LCVQYG